MRTRMKNARRSHSKRMKRGSIFTVIVALASVLAVPEAAAGSLTATKPEPLDVIHYNIAGATKNAGSFPIIGRIVAEVKQRRPDVLSINEICSHQYDHLREQLAAIGYQMHAIFHAALRLNPTCGGVQEDGNALFVLGEVLQEHRYYFDRSDKNRLKEGQNLAPLAVRWQTVACLTTRFSNPGMPVKVCTTHLQSKGENGDIYAEPRAQAAELARVFGPQARQQPFILAGDFNLPIHEYGLDQLYNDELLGDGPFGELATTVQYDDDDGASERVGIATHSQGKLDYVFVSQEFASNLAATGVVDHGNTCTDDQPCSDHRMVYGIIERQVPNGYTVHCPHGYTCLFSEPDFGGREVAVKGCEFRNLAEFDFRDVVSSWARNHPADDVLGRAYNAGDGAWFPLWTMGASESGNVAGPDNNAADAVDPCDDDATP